MAAELFMYETGTVVVGEPGVLAAPPRRWATCVGRRHVGHRAAGRQVGQDDGLAVGGEDVGALGHEMHAAEDDVVGLGPVSGRLRPA